MLLFIPEISSAPTTRGVSFITGGRYLEIMEPLDRIRVITKLIETVCNRSSYAIIGAIYERHRDQMDSTVSKGVRSAGAPLGRDKDEFQTGFSWHHAWMYGMTVRQSPLTSNWFFSIFYPAPSFY